MFNQYRIKSLNNFALPVIALFAVLVSPTNELIASDIQQAGIGEGVRVELFELKSDAVDASVEISALLPPGFDPEIDVGLPLVIWLHG